MLFRDYRYMSIEENVYEMRGAEEQEERGGADEEAPTKARPHAMPHTPRLSAFLLCSLFLRDLLPPH